MTGPRIPAGIDPEDVETLREAIDRGDVIVCGVRCYRCMYGGEHHDPPKWHTWADAEDVEHAAATGQPDPRDSRCGCPCADAPR